MLVGVVGAVGLSARFCMGEINHLWNTGTGASRSAWTFVIVFYYPIQLWYSRYSALNVLVGVVGAVGLSARFCMGEINHLWNTGTGASRSAWTFVIVFYYPIQLR